jgi:hypothetical protein
VFENRVLRKIIVPKKDEVTGEWRRLHNEELYDLYSTPNIIRVMKSRLMRWADHVARIGDQKVHTGFGLGNLSERDHLEDPSIDGRVILKLILKKEDVKAWIGLIWLGIGTGGRRL